jgi:hypothetical protein
VKVSFEIIRKDRAEAEWRVGVTAELPSGWNFFSLFP